MAQHTNALAGLKDGGVFIIQSEQGSPDKVWADIPERYQEEIIVRFEFFDELLKYFQVLIPIREELFEAKREFELGHLEGAGNCNEAKYTDNRYSALYH